MLNVHSRVVSASIFASCFVRPVKYVPFPFSTSATSEIGDWKFRTCITENYLKFQTLTR